MQSANASGPVVGEAVDDGAVESAGTLPVGVGAEVAGAIGTIEMSGAGVVGDALGSAWSGSDEQPNAPTVRRAPATAPRRGVRMRMCVVLLEDEPPRESQR